jgi:hypothetical protein
LLFDSAFVQFFLLWMRIFLGDFSVVDGGLPSPLAPLPVSGEGKRVCSLLPYVEEELGMRGMRAGGRLGEKQPGLLLEDVYVRALGRMVLPADNQQLQPGAAGNQFRQAAAVKDERRG